VKKSEFFGELLCVPIVHRQELQGVLALNRPKASFFSAQELRLAERAAEGLAAALWASRTLQSHGETSGTWPH